MDGDLEARVEELTAEVEQLRSSRRHALRLVGAAVVSGAAAALTAGRPAAAVSEPMITESIMHPAKETLLEVGGKAALYGFGVVDQQTSLYPELGRPAIVGHAGDNNFNVGVAGFGNGAAVTGVIGMGAGGDMTIGVRGSAYGTGAIGVQAYAFGTDVTMIQAIAPTADTGLLVRAVSAIDAACTATTGGHAITGAATGNQGSTIVATHDGVGRDAVAASSPNGVGVSADGQIGLAATGTLWGAVLEGTGGAVKLSTTASATPPARSTAFVQGALEPDAIGGLWWCVADGTPGTWRQVSGADTAGAFHAMTPTRVYDSRVAVPAPGTLAPSQSRTISVADGRNLTTGAVTVKDLVPAGATAITCNVTVVDTAGAGFLTLNPGGTSTVGAASINWFGPGQILNNGTVAAIAADRTITIVCGGSNGASTDVVLDITGYYR